MLIDQLLDVAIRFNRIIDDRERNNDVADTRNGSETAGSVIATNVMSPDRSDALRRKPDLP